MKILDINFKEYKESYWVQTKIELGKSTIYTTNTFSNKEKAKEFEKYLKKHKVTPFNHLGLVPHPYIAYPKYENRTIMELKATFVLYKLTK